MLSGLHYNITEYFLNYLGTDDLELRLAAVADLKGLGNPINVAMERFVNSLTTNHSGEEKVKILVWKKLHISTLY